METKANKRSSPEVIVFEDPRKKKKGPTCQLKSIKTERSQLRVFPASKSFLEQTKREVQRFSLTAYEEKDKKSAMENYLVKLGAKPEKKHYNFKEYIEMKRKEIVKQKKEAQEKRLYSDGHQMKSKQKTKQFKRKRQGYKNRGKAK